MSRFVSPLLAISLLAPGVSSQSYCSGRQEITSAGSSVSSTYGKVVIIGDSLLAGRGNTQGRYETAISQGLDDTKVINNAVGGNSLETIADSVACSCVSDCRWAVINGGINGHRNRDVSETVDQMKELVQRELDSGRSVVIQGYVPDCDRNASGETFDGFLDGYSDFAAATENVWFVDPRQGFPGHELIGMPCEDTENLYRADDLSHPSPLSGEVMGIAVADIIRSQSGDVVETPNDDETETDDEGDNENENESDAPTPTPNENESDDENDNDNDNDEETPNITVRPTLRPTLRPKAAKKASKQGKVAKKTNKKARTRALRVRKV